MKTHLNQVPEILEPLNELFKDEMRRLEGNLPQDLHGRDANWIISEVNGVGRICYPITSKPPVTIEWE